MSAHDDYLNPDRHDPALQDDDGDSQAMAVLTLRDYFAARAMQGALVNARIPGLEVDPPSPDVVAVVDGACRAFYRIADAMLKARNA